MFHFHSLWGENSPNGDFPPTWTSVGLRTSSQRAPITNPGGWLTAAQHRTPTFWKADGFWGRKHLFSTNQSSVKIPTFRKETAHTLYKASGAWIQLRYWIIASLWESMNSSNTSGQMMSCRAITSLRMIPAWKHPQKKCASSQHHYLDRQCWQSAAKSLLRALASCSKWNFPLQELSVTKCQRKTRVFAPNPPAAASTKWILSNMDMRARQTVVCSEFPWPNINPKQRNKPHLTITTSWPF